MDVRHSEKNPTPQERVVSTNEARQGTTGHNVRYVLIVGTVSVIVLFTIVYLFFFPR